MFIWFPMLTLPVVYQDLPIPSCRHSILSVMPPTLVFLESGKCIEVLTSEDHNIIDSQYHN